MLVTVLQEHIPQLRDQISNTDNYDLRQLLKQREEILQQLLQRLDGNSQTQPPVQPSR